MKMVSNTIIKIECVRNEWFGYYTTVLPRLPPELYFMYDLLYDKTQKLAWNIQ